MYFTHLEAENFLSIGSVQMDLAKRGLLVIVGENYDDPSAASNGAGKSALIESIYWCLYGTTLRGIKYVDSVVNRKAKKNCRVKFTLQTKDGTIIVERFRKHKDHKNATHVYLNGVAKHSTDPRVTQRTINMLLDMDSDTFSRLILIGQGFTQRFSTMSDRELKEFIEGLTGSILYAKAHSAAKDRLVEIQKQKAGQDQSREALRTNTESLKEQIEQEKINAQAAETSRTEKVAEYVKVNSVNQAEVQAISQAMAQVESEKAANVSQYDKQITEWETHIGSLQTSLQGIITQQDQWRETHRQSEQEALAGFDASMQVLRKQHSDETSQIESSRVSLVEARDTETASADVAQMHLIDSLKASREPSEAAYEALRVEVDALVPPAVDTSLHADLATAQARLEALNKSLAAEEARSGTTCPTCGQEVTDEHVQAHIRDTIDPDAARSDIVYGPKGINNCESAIKEAQVVVDANVQRQTEARNKLQADYAALKALADDHQRQIEVAEAQNATIPAKHEEGIKAVELQIAELRGKQTAAIESEEGRRADIRKSFSDSEAAKDTEYAEARKGWDTQVEESQKSCKDVRAVREQYIRATDSAMIENRDQMGTYEHAITDNNTEIAKLEAQDLRVALKTLEGNLVGVEKQIADIDAQAVDSDNSEYVYLYLVAAFGLGGIRSYMMDSILSYLNERLKIYCHHLFDGVVGIELSPIFEQKNKSVVDKISLIVTTHGGSYDASSGGERRKIDVALFLSFRDLNRMLNPVQVNLEAYDEILSFLDGESASRVVQLLVADQSVETKILITHRSDVPIIGPHTIIKAVKQLGVTSYVTV